MDILRQNLIDRFGSQRILIPTQDEPSAQNNYSSALRFTAHDTRELIDAVIIAKKSGVSYEVYDFEGEEDNPSSEVKGLLIKNNARRLEVVARKGKILKGESITDFVLIEAESGVPFSQIVRFSLDGGFGGIESGLGLKGSLRSLFNTEQEFIHQLTRNNTVQTVKVLKDDLLVTDIAANEYNSTMLVLSVVFKLHGEDSKILWLKAEKALRENSIKSL